MGRRRSASTTMTRYPELAISTARLAVTVVLPSSGWALVTSRVRVSLLSGDHRISAARRWMASSATTGSAPLRRGPAKGRWPRNREGRVTVAGWPKASSASSVPRMVSSNCSRISPATTPRSNPRAAAITTLRTGLGSTLPMEWAPFPTESVSGSKAPVLDEAGVGEGEIVGRAPTFGDGDEGAPDAGALGWSYRFLNARPTEFKTVIPSIGLMLSYWTSITALSGLVTTWSLEEEMVSPFPLSSLLTLLRRAPPLSCTLA